jgi:DNA repair exonuclease SbcCD nuclease subunit
MGHAPHRTKNFTRNNERDFQMKELFVCSDVHVGSIRTAGTSPSSALALRQYILGSFEELLKLADGRDLLINGDLYDTNSVPLYDLLESYRILAEWLRRNPESVLYNSRGNHCISKSSAQLSSWSFLGDLLAQEFGERSVAIDEPTMTPHGYVIPHLLNQDLFDAALAATPKCDVVYLHCNVDNNFATQSDHSLNVTSTQLLALPCKHVVCGHEHHQRTVGKCLLPGNQIPTSISDCLHTKAKYCCSIESGEPTLHLVGEIDAWYAELDWRNPTESTAKFIRFIGTATAEEGVAVANTIATYRKNSDAFVVGNAVKIESVDDGSMAESLEDVKAFDVLGALKELLSAAEVKKLESLK